MLGLPEDFEFELTPTTETKLTVSREHEEFFTWKHNIVTFGWYFGFTEGQYLIQSKIRLQSYNALALEITGGNNLGQCTNKSTK